MRARIAMLGAIVAIALAGCGGSGNDKADKASGGPAGIKVSQSALGPIITDQAGQTLYAFTKDKAGTSVCEGECIATWPAFASRSKVTSGQGVDQALVKHAQRSEGTFQAAYGDWPLYYYAGDGKPGDLDGQGVDNEWFVVGVNGKLIKGEA